MSIFQHVFRCVFPIRHPGFRLLPLAAVLLFLGAVAPVSAQFSGEFFPGGSGNDDSPFPSISATGSCVVKQLPEAMKFILTIQGRAKTFDEAYEKLKSEQAAALLKLEKLGIAKEKVQLDGIGIDHSQESKQRQMEMMISQRMRQKGQKPAAPQKVVTLTAKLTVEWPLEGKTQEDLLKESQAIQEKIREADFTPKTEELSPEDEELAEELAAMSYHSSDQENSTEPRILYIARAPEEEMRKAVAKAFDQAREQGEVLAEATGAILVKLMKISSSTAKHTASQNPYGRQDHDYYLMHMLNSQQYGSDSTRQLECHALTPDPVSFVFAVRAVFLMDPK